MEDEAVDARSTSRLGYTGLRDADRAIGKPKLPVNCAGVLVRERTQVDVDGPDRSLELRSPIVGLLKRMCPLRQVVRVAPRNRRPQVWKLGSQSPERQMYAWSSPEKEGFHKT